MNQKKIFAMLCISAVATVSGYVGMKTYLSNANDYDELLSQNVEALSDGEKSPISGNLVTCDGPSIYGFPRIVSGKFSCYEHTNQYKVKEDSTIVFLDNVTEISYEICAASGTGDYPGAEYTYFTTEDYQGTAECSNRCTENKNSILNDILYETRH